MLEIFDRSRRRVAIAENAHQINDQTRINSVWHLFFSLPYDDPKNKYCMPFCYVRYNGGPLYRIMPQTQTITDTGSVAYSCEHVLATLVDNVLFGYHVVGNIGTYTEDVIRYILDHQKVSNWVLHECDFHRQFEYGWEQESLLSALFSVATPLTDYIWVTDTSVYPWRLSLKKLNRTGIPELYVRRCHNMTSFGCDADPSQICTRLYPLGYGEGVNQLGIAGVNGGKPYLQSPKSVTDKYGIIEKVWIDRRYEDAGSLKAAAEKLLQELQEPLLSYDIGFYELPGADYEKAAVGKRIRIVFPEINEKVDTVVTEVNRQYDDITQSTIVVANRATNIAASIADLADRQRIEQSYAQGATQIYSQALQANCDRDSGAIMDFFIPQEMRIINAVRIKVRMGPFRAYSQSTSTEEAQVQSTTSSDDQYYSSSAGGGSHTTTDSGGGTYTSTSDGGGTYTSTSWDGDDVVTADSTVVKGRTISQAEARRLGVPLHDHGIPDLAKVANPDGGFYYWYESGGHIHDAHSHEVRIQSHSHSVEIPTHSHSVQISSHSHGLDIPDHSHTTYIPGHDHSVTIPAHSHDIRPGIYQFGNPQSFGLYINGVLKQRFSGTMMELDITEYLTDADNMIPRGQWMSIEIKPDDLAYVSMDLIVQGFVQSRGDRTV